jgi:hypothetical protein
MKLAFEPHEMCVVCNHLHVIFNIVYEAIYLFTFILPQNLSAEFLLQKALFPATDLI